ncbi:efflux transporter outer membrane subunit [Pseudoduganella violacea]|uniref:NodT family efflux transporter outer membrane factor (OMF) lipoprotein n=1 Tax=Pseudoduganella violacea TaxID=1715466 RepID=A0A7W5FSQ4_9BURK|nr:efflux transporter outer membrane subunit [Pseudoduganella violacea]MBB3117980.1 NodT family efflux transporter outer membrane factor (OMF) lipoprotein [Pseudoduganella violacea]
MKIRSSALAVSAALALAACGTSGPAGKVAAGTPPQWQAPLPHNGSITDLAGWWQHQGDPLLVELIEAAQQASPSIASAQSRIAQSRAARVASGAALAPQVNAVATSTRMSKQSEAPVNTTSQAMLQASWEIDLFGANRATRDAAQARYESAQAGWHEARVSVAAETANQYYSLRACERLLAVAHEDSVSRQQTANLTQLSAKAGFQSPANAALASASAADGRSREVAQRAACDIDVKALVALTALGEPELRQKLGANAAQAALVPAQGVGIASLPAHTLSQRPDVFTAEREVAASSFEVAGAQAERFPSLSISGSVGRGRIHANGANVTANTWTVGPLQMTLPIFDAGTRRANVDAAKARYEAAVSGYRGSVRQAVREVEEALVNLDSTAQRGNDAQTALDGYRLNFTATEDRYKNGLASLFELEDARRTRLAAETTVVGLQRERSAAWIALYRAAGGGWQAQSTDTEKP